MSSTQNSPSSFKALGFEHLPNFFFSWQPGQPKTLPMRNNPPSYTPRPLSPMPWDLWFANEKEDESVRDPATSSGKESEEDDVPKTAPASPPVNKRKRKATETTVRLANRPESYISPVPLMVFKKKRSAPEGSVERPTKKKKTIYEIMDVFVSGPVYNAETKSFPPLGPIDIKELEELCKND